MCYGNLSIFENTKNAFTEALYGFTLSMTHTFKMGSVWQSLQNEYIEDINIKYISSSVVKK